MNNLLSIFDIVEIECDHARSVNFFAESIVSPVGFPACRCDNWDHYVKGECPCGPDDMVFMGEHSPHTYVINQSCVLNFFSRKKDYYHLSFHYPFTSL